MCVDQVAMALALADLGVGVTDLDACWNLPTHIPTSDPLVPAMVHYHTSVAETGEILSSGVPLVDEFIAKANIATSEVLAEFAGADEPTRVVTLAGAGGLTDQPELMSAYAGEVAHVARALLVIVADDFDLHRVEQRLRHAMVSVGVDPDDCPDMVLVPPSADLAPLRPSALLTDAPGCPLATDLPRWRAGARDRAFRDLALLEQRALIGTAGPSTNPCDIDPATLAGLAPYVERRDLLLELVDRSRKELGFFPATAIRCIEYPWFLAAAEELPAGSSIVDFGAGVSALPLALSARGHSVTTVDSHHWVRTHANKAEWNEWGFLDYASIDPRITSYNEPFESAPLGQQNAVFSVSVIEHMPAIARREAFAHAALILEPGGLLRLSIDVAPGTTDLRNRNYGEIVDDPAEHGTVADVLDELEALGFAVEPAEFHRGVPHSRTDIALIQARR